MQKLLENCKFAKFEKSDPHKDFKLFTGETRFLQNLAILYIYWNWYADMIWYWYLCFKNHWMLTSISLSLLGIANTRAGKIRFSGAQKSVLLKVNSGDLCAPHNFLHLVPLQGACVHLIVYLVIHQMKYVMERWSNAMIFWNFLM